MMGKTRIVSSSAGRLWPRAFLHAAGGALLLLSAAPAHAQLSFFSAINLALQNSPKIKSAEDGVRKAQAALAVLEDAYIPSVNAGGGAGATYGITLSVPTIFTLSAHSLVYSPQQRDYIRAARSGVEAAQLSLADARNGVEEDTVITYLRLEDLQLEMGALDEERGLAEKLVDIVQEREQAGLANDLDLIKARRTAVQLKLQELQAKEEQDFLAQHLSDLTGVSDGEGMTVPASIPAIPMLDETAPNNGLPFPDSLSLQSTALSAKAQEEKAHGDSRYRWLPQITFDAQYGRVSPINDVSDYYNLHGRYNVVSAGVQFQFPLLDQVRKAAAREAQATADGNAEDADQLRMDQKGDQIKLEHSLDELATQAELAELDEQIAKSELDAAILQQKSAAGGGPPLTPIDEVNARLQERQQYYNVLEAKFALEKDQIYLLRQTGNLGPWIERAEKSALGTGLPPK
ncbi:MAG TPA: TolC family protein [Acidobacteriaceae bacterium]|jgi:outer membrane protein TolC|nr:TolC family protein [Acidobacteriaceae bacterium]